MKQRLISLVLGAMLGALSCTSTFAADAVNDDAHFDIARFDVQGNTLLSKQTIDSAVAPYVGKQRGFGDVMQALEALETLYHARGYELVRIDLPEQVLDQGVVVLDVVETRIGKVIVEGNKNFSEASIRRSLPGLKEGEIPDLKVISKNLKLANENPSRKTIMKLGSGEQDGVVDATLGVKDQSPWLTTVTLDNTGSDSTGKDNIGVVLQNANMFGLDHVMTLQYATTLEHPSAVSVYALGYHVPLYALGDSMDFSATHSDVDAGTVTAGILNIAVSGKGSTYGTRYNHNLATVGSYQSKVIYGVDYKEYKNSIQTLGIELGNNVTVHPWSVGYLSNWALLDGTADMSLTFLQNIAGGSSGRQSDFDLVRSGADANYKVLHFAATTSQPLPGDWLARVVLNAQYSRNALIPGEQFGAGGSSSVRGFQEREVSNDSGATANFEVYTAPLCGKSDWQCRLLAFYDTAYLSRNNPLPGEITHMAISSVGIGARLQLRNDLSLQMDYGYVVHAEATTTQKGDARLHARLALSF
jgi:hemolysin activation/secretion protein